MILAVTNQKGGVGKTTTCLNLGAIAARDGKRTCLIDLDPQGNLTKTFLDLKASHLTAYDLLNYSTPFREAVIPIGDNLSLVPAQISLSRIERLGADDPALPYRLKEKLAGYAETFDLIILDTPPTLGALTVNAMTAATHLLLPIQASYYSLQGTNDLMETYRLVKAKLNPALKLLGILITMYDPRTTLAKEVVAEIRSLCRPSAIHRHPPVRETGRITGLRPERRHLRPQKHCSRGVPGRLRRTDGAGEKPCLKPTSDELRPRS